MVEWVRISEGTGSVLGIWNRKLLALPKTGYLMTYNSKGCTANCLFCPQAGASGSDKLSRISWPKVRSERIKEKLLSGESAFNRFCIQSLNYPKVMDDICEIVTLVNENSNVPISVSCQPIGKSDMKRLKEAGVDRLGIPLDAATPEVFSFVKGEGSGGPYEWRNQIGKLEKAKSVFGERVTTHLIVGLGEKEEEMVNRIQFFKNREITVGLFAFTLVKGSQLSDKNRPYLSKYRRIQLAKYIIEEDLSEIEDMTFKNGRLNDFGISSGRLESIIASGNPFVTSGCPDCNRPYYNESPSGPIYNFPKKPEKEDINRILNMDLCSA